MTWEYCHTGKIEFSSNKLKGFSLSLQYLKGTVNTMSTIVIAIIGFMENLLVEEQLHLLEHLTTFDMQALQQFSLEVLPFYLP